MPGILIIDHSQGQGIDGKQGKKQEYETVNCIHCQNMIALLRRCNDVHALSNIDIAKATPVAQDLSANFVGRYRCRYCDRAICRECACSMEKNGGVCPGPWHARVEAVLTKAAKVNV